MRVALWLLAAPAVALALCRLAGPLSVAATLAVALGGQAVAHPLWCALERRRAVRELRRLRRLQRAGAVRISVLRGRHTWGEVAFQLALRVIGAVLVAAAFRLDLR